MAMEAMEMMKTGRAKREQVVKRVRFACSAAAAFAVRRREVAAAEEGGGTEAKRRVREGERVERVERRWRRGRLLSRLNRRIA
jgi:hypothetical protein